MQRILRMASTFSACLILNAETQILLPPFPAISQIRTDENTPAAHISADGLVLPIAFTETTARAYWDIPLPQRLSSKATALEFEIACPNPSLLRSLSIHLKSGNGWHAFPIPLIVTPHRQSISLPKGIFTPEDDPGDWYKATAVRLSAWKQSAGNTSLTLFSLKARRDAIAVVRSTSLTAPGEIEFAVTLANRCARLLTKADIPFAYIDDTCTTLSSYRLLLLPYAPQIPGQTAKHLTRFVKQGGKLMVFYQASPPLAALLGVRLGAWQGTEPGHEWSSIVPDPHILPAVSNRMPHLTNSLFPPYPTGAHQARVAAVWSDATGRVTDTPACLISHHGAWFGHVPPQATPAAASFLRALVQDLCPELPLSDPPSVPATVPLPPARPGELRGVWESSGYARHPRGWNGLLSILAKHGINTVFAHWQSAGTAHYLSHGKRVESTRPRVHRTDPLDDALKAGAKHNIAMHAWVTCWTLEGCDPAQQETLTREDRLMRDAAGNPLPWLCPSIPANRELLIEGCCDLARRGVAGIHLDYIRFPEETGCYAPATRAAFEAQLGKPLASWPGDVLANGTHHAAFRRFRFAVMTDFVRDTRQSLRAINPSIKLSAAVFPTPEGALIRGQDWPIWVSENLVDFVCPMIYTEQETAFTAMLKTCAEALPNPSATLVPGIGTSADESQLDAAAASRQIRACREHKLAGFAFFALDDALLTLLPDLLP